MKKTINVEELLSLPAMVKRSHYLRYVPRMPLTNHKLVFGQIRIVLRTQEDHV